MKELIQVTVKTPETTQDIADASAAYAAAWSFLYGKEEMANFDATTIIESYPEGFFTVYSNGQPAGNFTTFRTNYDLDDQEVAGKTWRELSNGGVNDTHIPDGDTLYGSALGVDPAFPGQGLAIQAVEAAKLHCIEKNIKQLVLGCRIPDYHNHKELSVEEYIKLRRADFQFLDRELRFYARCGMTFTKGLPNYMSGADADPDSLDYGVQTVWLNPLYKETTKK